MAGYSGTSLARKLGMKAGARVQLVNAPGNYADLIAPLPQEVKTSTRFRSNVDLCHFFTRRDAELKAKLPRLMKLIRQDGCIWVSWPKRASGVKTDVTEDRIRDACLPLGLVDIKVCAVDETWSGLKLVIRKALRR